MPVGVKFRQLFEFGVDLCAVVQLFPEKRSVQDIFVVGHGLPDISLFEGVLDDSRVVSRPDNIPVFLLLGFDFHRLRSSSTIKLK